jgi:alpha-beta hydrolase superfamily lysophospholipase
MYRRSLLLAALACALSARRARAAPAPVTLHATDGVVVYGDLTRAGGVRRGSILLFHQAGSNRGEYETIAPRLAQAGFDTLAIDQRSGGGMWGRHNQTMDRLGGDPGYAAALADLDAALTFAAADNPKGPLLVWGSSYSAALVFLLASRRPALVAAVLAFSPGEYIDGADIGAAAAMLHCPVFVTSASDAEEEGAAAALLGRVRSPLRRQYRPVAGVHGSSTLRTDRNAAGAEANWQAVLAFLDAVAPKR